MSDYYFLTAPLGVGRSVEDPFESSRRFTLFSYCQSHGLLLLRSGKAEMDHTRIEILFKDVRAMEIRSWFTGIAIREMDPADLGNRPSCPKSMIETGLRGYVLVGIDWEGFILAGSHFVCEDNGGFSEPSSLLSPSVSVA